MIPQGSSEELRAGFWQTAARNRLVVRQVGSTQRKAAHLNTQEVVKPLLSEHDFACFASARQSIRPAVPSVAPWELLFCNQMNRSLRHQSGTHGENSERS